MWRRQVIVVSYKVWGLETRRRLGCGACGEMVGYGVRPESVHKLKLCSHSPLFFVVVVYQRCAPKQDKWRALSRWKMKDNYKTFFYVSRYFSFEDERLKRDNDMWQVLFCRPTQVSQDWYKVKVRRNVLDWGVTYQFEWIRIDRHKAQTKKKESKVGRKKFFLFGQSR